MKHLIHVQSSTHLGLRAETTELVSAFLNESGKFIILERYMDQGFKTMNLFAMVKPEIDEIPFDVLRRASENFNVKIKTYTRLYNVDATLDKEHTCFIDWKGDENYIPNFDYQEQYNRVEELFEKGFIYKNVIMPLTIRIYPGIDENRLPTVKIITSKDVSLEELSKREGLGLFFGLHPTGIWVYGNTGKELYRNLTTAEFKYPVAVDVGKVVSNLDILKDKLYVYFIYRQLYKTVPVNILRTLFVPSAENYPIVDMLMDDIKNSFISGKTLSRNEIFKLIEQYGLPEGVKYNEQL